MKGIKIKILEQKQQKINNKNKRKNYNEKKQVNILFCIHFTICSRCRRRRRHRQQGTITLTTLTSSFESHSFCESNNKIQWIPKTKLQNNTEKSGKWVNAWKINASIILFMFVVVELTHSDGVEFEIYHIRPFTVDSILSVDISLPSSSIRDECIILLHIFLHLKRMCLKSASFSHIWIYVSWFLKKHREFYAFKHSIT